ncbi:PREDICTED: nose resistant to fluoxetine protein 6-like [Priapulus caudatus]|uniref:Nose resistant to fluoxetine protein 6-like n=1 Tax=Priapulus caudatus TaxID=37621 RepID=A0ABM1F412_PRICU|nr:PREDICTED: nose resistant to fluoxetine protein 6-like [Priapulus caudatus]
MDHCLGWTWFIACMMQFYFVSPVFILMLRKNWKIGVAFVVACIAASMVTTGVLTVNYGLPSTYLGPASVNTTDTGIDHIYTKPYTRISPFLVGVLLGYYFAVTKNRRVKINPFVVVVSWLLSITVALLVVFGLIDHYSNILDPNYKSVLSKAIYNSCARFAWSLTIAWTIFACATGNGEFNIKQGFRKLKA